MPKKVLEKTNFLTEENKIILAKSNGNGKNKQPLPPETPTVPTTPTVVTPSAPTIVADDVADTIDAFHPSYADSEIVISVNNGDFTQFSGSALSVGPGNIPAGFYRFKIKAGTNRNESAIVSSPAFNATVVTPPVSTTPSYTVTGTKNISAGVYSPDNVLVRTLIKDGVKPAGTYPLVWDGTKDDGTPAPVGDYNIKVLTNDVKIDWQGVVGNSSTSLNRQEIYSSLDAPSKMEIIGTKAYYLVGYNEGQASVAAFDLNNIQVRKDVFNGAGGIPNSEYMATDGVYIYLATFSAYHPEFSFVYARKISDGTIYNFSAGFNYAEYNPFFGASVADYRTTSWRATGLAVTSSYIFVSYGANNTIVVLNKATGALVRTITMTKPSALAVEGTNMWVTLNDTTVQKFPINADGSLGTGSTSITGLSTVIDMKVSNGLLAVVDGGNSQQVKAFNTSNGSSAWVLGQPGGIKTSPVVTSDRFGFWMIHGDAIKHNRGGIAFQTDGSFWVIDPSNGRMMHFSASRVLIESIMYMQHVRTCALVGNDNKRLIGNGLEFQVDYTNPLNNGWTLKYNWEGNLNNFVTEEWIKHVQKLSNGRTYGCVYRTSGHPQDGGSGLQIVELNPTTGVRYTASWVRRNIYGGARLYPDGTIYGLDDNNVVEKWVKMPFTGFDSNNDPLYGANVYLPISLPLTSTDVKLGSPYPAPYEVTSSNILTLYNGGVYSGEDGIPHLGGMDATTGKVMFRTMYSTFQSYAGDAPLNGFDVGNGAGMGVVGSTALALSSDRLIVAGYPCEGHKSGQANFFYLYYDNGLFIGRFGVEGQDFVLDPVKFPGMAGNAYSFQFTKENGEYFLYHGDESVKGGVHRWRISNTTSIQEQVIPISSTFTRSSEDALSTGITDLHTGLPRRSVLAGTVANWTVTPKLTSDYLWDVRTNNLTYDKRKPNDITIYYNAVSALSVSRPISSGSTLTNWQLAGRIAYNGVDPNYWDAAGASAYFDILDNTGKIIVRVHQISDVPHANTFFKVNNTVIFTKGTADMQNFTRNLKNISITRIGSSISVTFDTFTGATNTPYETGANFAAPARMRVYFSNPQGQSGEKKVSITDFKFNNNLQIA
jgi:hypothetical protein